jgi:hypothetical protein
MLTLAISFIALATTSLPATLPASAVITTDSLPVTVGPGSSGIDAASLVMVADYEKDMTATLTAASLYTTPWTFAGMAVATIIAVLAIYLAREWLFPLRTITDDGLRLRHKDGLRCRHPGVKLALA